MNLSGIFVRRPVATTLLTIAIALAGLFAYARLPVSPLPQVDFPTILVQAQQPGASPETMATSVAAPLERHLGQIADVAEMTSQSSLGTTRIVMQFGLDRDINGAARDVQAAINAAAADLPTSLRLNPTYRKVNPADAPILVLAMTSETLAPGQLYDSAANVLQQRLSQLSGIGEVDVTGSALPAVRVELNPNKLSSYGVGLEDIRAALASANANSPKGAIENGNRRWQLYANDQASHAAAYRGLVVAYRNGNAVRLSDLGDVVDSVEDLRNAGFANGQPAVLIICYRQPGANIIDAVDNVRRALPQLEAALPADVHVWIASDRSSTIRSSLRDTQRTLLISVGLVILVVFAFLRNGRATLIPSVAVPISIIGTFGVMYLLNYSLDNLSLMALTIATGFVVDDAIVVLENTSRHMEAGVPRMRAALLGAREVGFTVLSMSLSLVAVFLPILLMGGIVGRLFREFAVTLTIAILISLVISLTTTPMMCAKVLRVQHQTHGRVYRASEWVFSGMVRGYDHTLGWALRHSRVVMLLLLATIGLNFYLFKVIPKGFFPEQDTGRLIGSIMADQSISFQLMRQKMALFMKIVQRDPAVETVVGFTGGRAVNSGFAYVVLKPISAGRPPIDLVMARLRRSLNKVPGARLFLQPVQDIRAGGRASAAAYQFTLQGDSPDELYTWADKLTAELRHNPILVDVNSDQQQRGLQTNLKIDRATAARLNLVPSTIDQTLYDAFGQRQVSVIYSAMNQYHVVMEVAPKYWQSPRILGQLYVSTSGATAAGTQTTNFLSGDVTGQNGTAPALPLFAAGTGTTASNTSSNASAATTTVAAGNSAAATSAAATIALDSERNQSVNAISNIGKGVASSGAPVTTAVETMVPLSAFIRWERGNAPISVNHQGMFVASTISFNLPPGRTLGDATVAINAAMRRIGMPASIHGSFSGTAAVFQQSLKNEPILIGAALAAVYIVLGILYESYIHPLTILSTLPSAGIGALLALMLFGYSLTIMALIGLILLIGIVKKNAIMMIDFALEVERTQGLGPREAIYQACLLRFRPIMMTTFAAGLGALPLAFGSGEGSEMRHPLGVAIVGGLIVSQLLTLYTTPVVYLYLDRFRWWAKAQWERLFPGLAQGGAHGGAHGGVPEAGE